MNTSRETKASLRSISIGQLVFQTATFIALVTCGMCCLAQVDATQDVPEPLHGYSYSFPAMGSTFEISAYTDDPQKLEQTLMAIEAEVLRLNAVFSDYDPTSELERLLAAPDPAALELSTDLYQILKQSEYWYQASDGIFDPSIGQLTHLWRKRRRSANLPSEKEIAEAKSHCGWHLVELDHQTRRINFRDSQVQIDLGGIATGFTVDRCFEMLTNSGVDCCLVNNGGDIRCGSAPPGRDGWNIEVAALEKSKASLHRLKVRNCAITTSGDLWRFTEVNGVRRSHIIDPRTGIGVPGPSSVTVISRTCIEVDVLGTTLSVLGAEQGMQFLAKNYPEVDALFAWSLKALMK